MPLRESAPCVADKRPSSFLEAPKSANLTMPLLSTRMFAPLISDWGERFKSEFTSVNNIMPVEIIKTS